MRSSFKVITFGILIITSIIYMGCSNDFEVNAPAKDIPVVYALLSKTDDIHYLRIERAFLEDGVPATELAQQSDKLYYGDGTTVSLTNIETQETFVLERVNSVDAGIIRDNGIFAQDPNILYSVDGDVINLNANNDYQLTIDRGNGLPTVTATTKIVGDMILASPVPNNSGPRTMRIVPDFPLRISLRADPVNGALYDVSFTINYQERTPSDNTFVSKSIIWKAINESKTGEQLSAPGQEFYGFMAGAIGETDPSTIRRMSTIDVKYVVGGEVFADFRRVLQANAGITGAEDAIPNFTNLSEGRGLFSSRNILIEEGFQLNGESIDSLISNQMTKDLNFVR